MGLAKSISDNTQQGWHALLELSFQKAPDKTVLHRRKRFGPLSVQRAFYPEKDVCHIYLLHPPGGVVGGDRLDINIELKADAHSLLTTPGATKFYRSAGQTATQVQRFTVAKGATLEWLPQENIYFPGSCVHNHLELHLQENAHAVIWDIQCLGRPAINEKFDSGFLDNQWKIFRNEQPLMIERLRVGHDNLDRLAILNNHPVVGNFVMTSFNHEYLQQVRDICFNHENEMLAATTLDELLVVRYLGDSTENARRLFSKIWSLLRKPHLKKEPIVPRIWNT